MTKPYPPIRTDGTSGPTANWRTLVQPYIKSQQVLACPSNSRNKLDTVLSSTTVETGMPVSYQAARVNAGIPTTSAYPSGETVTGQGGAWTYVAANVPGVNIAKISDAATCLSVVESTAKYTTYWIADTSTVNIRTLNPDNNNPGGAMFNGHLDTTNFLFFDGHVKAMRPMATLSTANGGSGSTNMWAVDGADLTTAAAAAARTNLSFQQK